MKTIGEQRVRTEFNPSNDGIIDQIKQKSAELINLINDLKLSDCPGDHPDKAEPGEIVQGTKEGGIMNDEFYYLKEMGCRQIEDGCMWAVKAATIKL